MRFPELDSLFRELLATNLGPGYGLSVVRVAADLSVVDVELRLLAGRTYCCAEPGCHLPRGIMRLVRLAAQRSIGLPESVIVRWHCHVERGAKLECRRQLALSVESDAYEFEATSGGPTAEERSSV